MAVVVNTGHSLPGLLVAPTHQTIITTKQQNCRGRRASEKEQTQRRRRKGVVKGRGFDGGKKLVFVAKPEIYGKRLVSLHLSKGQGQVKPRHLMQNKAVTC